MPMAVTFEKTEIPDVFVAKTGVFEDERGFFSEAFSQRVWSEAGFEGTFVQDNLSRTAKGALRGMHYQLSDQGMGKLIRVISGAVFDVAVDLRKGSPSFGKWVGRTLSSENRLCLWVPVGFAHGFVSLEDDTDVWYKCTGMHSPERERALSYKDPAVGIEWPMEPTIVSKKDEVAPMLADAEYDFVYEG